ncbi:glycosyl transferase family 1 [Hyphobacterium sp. CCMP332]|nr:glycosyl transferase family 1 [Hyphobacterium sp. CCMP332]
MEKGKKRVLIITYYWPPMGGGGVQRWLKMVKYMREYGWEPVIFTSKNASNPIHDESLFADLPPNLEIIHQEIFEPYNLYNQFLGRKKDEKVFQGFVDEKGQKSLLKEIAIWLRGNIFIPDARMFWIRPSFKKLKEYLKENPVNAIISTGPPHSTHVIAYKIKKEHGLPWLADFRDPWTNIDFYQQLKLTKVADLIHKKLENKIMCKSDALVTVTWNWGKEMEEIRGSEVDVITNGFDPADFKNANGNQPAKFSILHAGSLNRDRNPFAFWVALEKLLKEEPELKNELSIDLIGPLDFSVLESLKKHQLDTFLHRIENLPHREVVEKMTNAAILLLPLNDTPNISGVVPGKLYEYIGAKRPILAIGSPSGDSSKIIQMTNAGLISDFGNNVHAFENLRNYYTLFQKGQLKVDSKNSEQFSRRNLVGDIVSVLNRISKN